MTNNSILTLTSPIDECAYQKCIGSCKKRFFVSLVTRIHACRLNSQYKSIWCKLLLDLLAFINSIAWENSRHLATLPITALVSPPNDVWETSAEIPYWWRVTTQIWLVVPGGKFDSANQKHYPDLGSDASSVWNFCVRFSDVIWWGNQW